MRVSEIYGFLPLYKRAGISSNREIQNLKNRLLLKKAGHCGTLDPIAEGVLPVLVNKATRTMRYFLNYTKTYRFTIQFGISTDTLDITGKVKMRSKRIIYREELERAIKKFSGVIKQKTPAFSARKYRGKSLYKYARNGISIPKSEKQINIESIVILDFNFPYAQLEVECSSGTYIRQLIEDICIELGVAGTMYSLTRSSYGIFNIENTKRNEQLSLKDILPITEVFYDFGRFEIDEVILNLASNGSPISLSNTRYTESGNFNRYLGLSNGEVIGIYRRDGDLFLPEVILFGKNP